MSYTVAFTPLLLPEPAAAAFLGVSPSKLRELGIPRRMLGAKRLYDQRDLIAYADALAYEGEGEADRRAADEAFGCR
ncbi:hypothetical protein [Thauera sp.]|uniref:hypothetical protein n=1 Tax=Thauera sp. TaxID=1905334 RepID=UPI002B8890BA|nr:hypothetical protein [Thauera sp.]HRP26366.1 hypothetical protein [Thauera sp.]